MEEGQLPVPPLAAGSLSKETIWSGPEPRAQRRSSNLSEQCLDPPAGPVAPFLPSLFPPWTQALEASTDAQTGGLGHHVLTMLGT